MIIWTWNLFVEVGVFTLKRLCWLIAILLLTLGLVSSCSSGSASPQVSQLTENEVRVFADPMTENILHAINTESYIDYTRDFTPTLKGNLPENGFKDVNAKRIEVVGSYVSKEFWQMTQKNDRITVAYKAKFVQEPADVILTVFFRNISNRWYVDGLKYDSPLMREYDC